MMTEFSFLGELIL